MKFPDVNVWLAAVWSRHSKHVVAKNWVDAEVDDLAFCRVTQMSFLRLLSNPAVTGSDALTRARAWDVYDQLIADPRIHIVDEPAGLDAAWIRFSRHDDNSHLLWTDDYLAAFAHASNMEFVTFDRHYVRRYETVHVITLH